ncbi:methyltransferase [Nocardiopsis coralliicola]
MSGSDGVLPADAQKMMAYTQGMWVSQVVRTVAALSVPEHLHAGPRTAQEIAAAEAADGDAVHRLLRAAVALDLAAYDAGSGRFSATRLLSALRRDVPGTLAHWAMVQTAPGHWSGWGAATEAVRTGGSRVPEALGGPLFDYFSANPDEGALFSAAMTDLTLSIGTDAAAAIDTAGTETAVDVGGANGAFLHELLAHNPALSGTVLETPAAAPGAAEAARAAGLGDRVAAVGGDFFDEVPAADLYLLKFILHDWDDEQGVQILRNCRRAMKPGGRVCIVEITVGGTEDPGLGAALMDLNMLMVTAGRERSLAEYDTLLEKAGLRRVRHTPIRNAMYPYAVIEAAALD